jgi:hypothetical protein
MFAIVATLALLGFAILMLARMFQAERSKMAAALQGHSWASQHFASVGPVTVRLSPRYSASRPMRTQPAMRAAA